MRGNSGAIRDAVLLQIILRVAYKPAADVQAGGSWIVKLDGVLKRQVGVRQHFIDHGICERQVIAFAGRGRDSETDQIG